MLALTATAIQKEEDTSHYRPTNSPGDREFAEQFEKQWHNELTQSFADDAMKEVDEIIGDALLEDENGNYLSMVTSAKKYALNSSTLQLGESGDGIMLPGVSSFRGGTAPPATTTNNNDDEDDNNNNSNNDNNNDMTGMKREVGTIDKNSISNNVKVTTAIDDINDDAKGKLNIENLKDDFNTQQDIAQENVNNNAGAQPSDIQLQEEQFGKSNNVDNGEGQLMVEEMEEDFGIANVVHDGGSNAILPGETKEEYQGRCERKA
jgi:hypothetical protein